MSWPRPKAHGQSGQAMVEYALINWLLAIAVLGALTPPVRTFFRDALFNLNAWFQGIFWYFALPFT